MYHFWLHPSFQEPKHRSQSSLSQFWDNEFRKLFFRLRCDYPITDDIKGILILEYVSNSAHFFSLLSFLAWLIHINEAEGRFVECLIFSHKINFRFIVAQEKYICFVKQEIATIFSPLIEPWYGTNRLELVLDFCLCKTKLRCKEYCEVFVHMNVYVSKIFKNYYILKDYQIKVHSISIREFEIALNFVNITY